MPKYSQKIVDHFSNPRNVGAIEGADGVGTERNDACGDTMTLYLRVEKNVIVDARFQARGCSTSIAAGSVVTELIKGKALAEARATGRRQIAEALDGLPPAKLHSGVLAADTLRAALGDYQRKTVG